MMGLNDLALIEGSHCVCVTGGRKFHRAAVLWTKLDDLREAHPGHFVLVHGANPSGADALADAWWGWRTDLGCTLRRFSADWETHGTKAGPIRNAEMTAFLADLKAKGWSVEVIACPDPKSRGTWDMVRKAKAAGIAVSVYENGEWRAA